MESRSSTIRSLLYFIRNDVDKIEEYISEVLKRDFKRFSSQEEILAYFNSFMDELYGSLTDEEIFNLRYYTGYSYEEINAVLRNNWNYDRNGHIDRKKDYEKISKYIETTFYKTPKIPGNIVVYRGVDLIPFQEYGIKSIPDLINMKGEFLYDSGLTSTSLLKETSFYDRELEYHSHCNILIEYYIPEECSDAIPLLDSNLSYSVGQNELLITPSSLGKVFDL